MSLPTSAKAQPVAPSVVAEHFAPDSDDRTDITTIKNVNPRYLRRVVLDDDDDDFHGSPSAQASLTAPPVPAPPPAHTLPRELVSLVRRNPRGIFKVVTPINVDVFEALLAKHPNRAHVESVCRAMREGFWPWAHIDKSTYPVTYDQSRPPPKKPKHREFLAKQRDDEIAAGRYSKSFGRTLLPGMYCMPVAVADGKKLRLISDHSAGKFCLNSMTPKGERSAVVDRIDHFGRVLLRRARGPAGHQPIVLFKSDVSKAYRNMPMAPLWQALQVVKINGSLHVDRCNTFGNAASSRIFCTFYSLVLWIAEHERGISDVLAYVDDNFSYEIRGRRKFYKPYNVFLPEKQARLLELWDELGIPHESKKQEWGHVLTVIGYEIDSTTLRISVPPDMRECVLKMITSFSDNVGQRRPMSEFQKILGLLNWVLDVNPLLRPGITALQREMSADPNAASSFVVSRHIVNDLAWLTQHFLDSTGIALKDAVGWRPEDADLTFYTDASLNGIGFWTPDIKLGFYADGSIPSDNINFTELFAVVCAIQWVSDNQLIHVPRRRRNTRLVIYSDSQAAVSIFNTLHTRQSYNPLLMLAVDILIEKRIDLRVLHIPGKENTVADHLSRGTHAALQRTHPHVVVKRYDIPKNLLDAAVHLWR